MRTECRISKNLDVILSIGYRIFIIIQFCMIHICIHLNLFEYEQIGKIVVQRQRTKF